MSIRVINGITKNKATYFPENQRAFCVYRDAKRNQKTGMVMIPIFSILNQKIFNGIESVISSSA